MSGGDDDGDEEEEEEEESIWVGKGPVGVVEGEERGGRRR